VEHLSGKRVLAAGKFDILHLGHLAYLEQAKELAGEDGELVVVIALDSTIKQERGAPPVFPQEQRKRLVEALGMVDRAVLGLETTDHSDIVSEIKPDIIALGYDQYTDTDRLQGKISEMSLETKITRLGKKTAGGLCSSSMIRERILRYYRENGRAK
jgi:FAD synthetase